MGGKIGTMCVSLDTMIRSCKVEVICSKLGRANALL